VFQSFAASLKRLAYPPHGLASKRHAVTSIGASTSHPRSRRQAVLPAALQPRPHPIEQVFAKIKTLLRKAAERTVEAVWKRIGTLLKAFKPQDFANAGYASK